MNNALFVIHSIIHSIVQQNYSFKEFIHSKKIQNNSFKKFIHSRKSKIIHSKKIFIQVKNGLSPMASSSTVLDLAGKSRDLRPRRSSARAALCSRQATIT